MGNAGSTLHLCAFISQQKASLTQHCWHQSNTEHGRSPDVALKVSLEMSLVVIARYFKVFSISSGTDSERKTFEFGSPFCRAGWFKICLGRQTTKRLIKILFRAFSVSDALSFRSVCPMVYLDTWLYHGPSFSPCFPTHEWKVSHQLKSFLLPFGQEVEFKSGFCTLMSLKWCFY